MRLENIPDISRSVRSSYHPKTTRKIKEVSATSNVKKSNAKLQGT